jgi:PAS domain S-box-containing protein
MESNKTEEDLREKIKVLQERAQVSERLFEFSPNAIVIIDQKTIVQVNRQLERIFGYARDELIGKPIEILIPERFVKQHAHYLTKFMETSEVLSWGRTGVDLYGRRRDGSEFPVDIMLSPFETAGGRQVMGTVRDITERNRAEQEIRTAKVTAENASRSKSEFLATMSHELRSPLNSIIGFSEILIDQSFGALNDKQKEYMNDVWESGLYLLSLINDILDLSKVEAGKMVLEPDEFDLQTVLPKCLVMVQERALFRGIEISMKIDDGINSIFADERRFKQIIYNLLSNAIKFTPEFGRIGLEVKRKDDKGVLFTVWDTGIGIEEKDKDKIFQEFVRISNSYSPQCQGTGLGLVLTKKLVELHGGQIWFESRGKDQGTRFSFVLPAWLESKMQDGSSSIQAAGAISTLKENEECPCVLLIEDEPKSVKLITEYLKDFNCFLNVASSAEEGFEKARMLKPFFIILDVILPNKNGWDVLAELKMDPLTKHIPVLMTTVVEARVKGLALGAFDYLVKPVSKNDFERVFKKVFSTIKEKSKPVKILVIDDDEDVLKIMGFILASQGFEILREKDSRKVLERIFQEKPDLIILDLIMDGTVTGINILVQLRDDPSTKDLPVVVLSGKTLTEQEEKVLQNHAAIIFEKSKFNKDVLLREIDLILKQKKSGS